MKKLKQIIQELLIILKGSYYSIIPIPNQFLIRNVPYYSQWESKELVDNILKRKISSKQDPKWKLSGAKTLEEYELWSWNMCGMTCLKMVLAHEKKKVIPIITLGRLCEPYGGYVHNASVGNDSEPWRKIDGLFYLPFVKFVEKEFGLKAKVVKVLQLRQIMYFISKGDYVLASVHGKIRDPLDTVAEKGGHLVLMLGYDKKKQLFYMHNPSGYYQKSQEYAKIRFSEFSKFFAYKGIIIKNI